MDSDALTTSTAICVVHKLCGLPSLSRRVACQSISELWDVSEVKVVRRRACALIYFLLKTV